MMITFLKQHAVVALLAALLAVCGALIALGTVEANVSLDSVGDLWSDTLRDADESVGKLARVRPADEAALGRAQAAGILANFREHPVDTAYVSGVGATLLEAGKPSLPYSFHVIESAAPNAFALLGGQVFVTRGMMDVLKSEAELAAILGHEIGHIELGHCRARFRYELSLKRVGAEPAGKTLDALRGPLRTAFSQDQELDADAHGAGRAGAAGYDRAAVLAVHARLAAAELEHQPRHLPRPARVTPTGEITGSLSDLVLGYFRSHPSWPERTERLKRLAVGGGYQGRRNFALREPKSRAIYPE